MCGMCHLRMRLCYNNRRCSMCNADMSRCVLVYWGEHGPADFHEYEAQYRADPGNFWHDQSWAPGVLVSKADPSSRQGGGPGRGKRRTPRLGLRLLRATSLSCRTCDKHAKKRYQTPAQLARHVSETHGRHMCQVCLRAGREFPRELDTYAQGDLRHHIEESHPPCVFCRTPFYDDEALHQHMRHAHVCCDVCLLMGDEGAFFRNHSELRSHLRDVHFVCLQGECRESGLVAFRTEAELEQHVHEQHSGRMPRFDRARQQQLDLAAAASHAGRAPAPAMPSGPGGRGGGVGSDFPELPGAGQLPSGPGEAMLARGRGRGGRGGAARTCTGDRVDADIPMAGWRNAPPTTSTQTPPPSAIIRPSTDTGTSGPGW
ncbi:unnamed protein product [Pedinophyceae sp. YPF-701]|nr:unnamed protein product [Pedinophyceae sp. YPF-701]